MNEQRKNLYILSDNDAKLQVQRRKGKMKTISMMNCAQINSDYILQCLFFVFCYGVIRSAFSKRRQR